MKFSSSCLDTDTKGDEMASQPQHTTFLERNAQYVASFGDKGSLALPPARKLAIVTCMDARLDPEAHLGLKEGDAHIIRNAGGVAKEALRSLILSQRLLGTREIAVFHHTDCGMLTFTAPDVQAIIKDAAPGNAEIAARVEAIDWLDFKDLEKAVKDDVAYLKSEPLILEGTPVTGWVYDVGTGKITQVA
ncbi:Carbonic anhydrase [Mycena indigotica]|uniref:Carbonic anhydrase n=1 Tax=Mycena indigotica TaxID=2126181 RepID=A0A8H6W1I7_9AGAR|nr:Carbonic anhydrase [Mycena indigotica]KAF7302114.1 Carbonic anhydrase [Mycena indigotica]